MAYFNPASSPVIMPGGLIVWNNLFTAAELDAIEQHGDRLTHEKAGLSAANTGRDNDPGKRAENGRHGQPLLRRTIAAFYAFPPRPCQAGRLLHAAAAAGGRCGNSLVFREVAVRKILRPRLLRVDRLRRLGGKGAARWAR